jgi:hypothetical protein
MGNYGNSNGIFLDILKMPLGRRHCQASILARKGRSVQVLLNFFIELP